MLTRMFSSFPVKLLLKCRCVCKAWDSLITNPSFIDEHLKKTAARKSELLLFRYYINVELFKGKEHYLLYTDETFPEKPVKELDCPLKCLSRFINIVGSCNGVICLSDDFSGTYTDRAALWNPSVRKIVSIPCANVTFHSHGPFFHSLGFGFDSKADDYKLVRVAYIGDEYFDFVDIPPLVEIFSLRERYWKRVHNNLNYVICECSTSAFVDGACHWVASVTKNGVSVGRVIVSFSLGDELFREMELPKCLVEEYIIMDVAAFDGSLLLVPFMKKNGKEDWFSVWIMREYGVARSWTKLFSFSKEERVERLVAFRQNGEILLAKRGGKLVSYDPNTKKTTATGIVGDARSFYLDTLVDSLVLIGESNEFTEEDASSCGSCSSLMEIDEASGESTEEE
uniref:F-box associated beta-propeller type 1 domain-containing protein n=2 Tax=Manihot esculenta TaxID=3983 RepID=A0A2C9VHG5_MANES